MNFRNFLPLFLLLLPSFCLAQSTQLDTVNEAFIEMEDGSVVYLQRLGGWTCKCCTDDGCTYENSDTDKTGETCYVGSDSSTYKCTVKKTKANTNLLHE